MAKIFLTSSTLDEVNRPAANALDESSEFPFG